jgi:hypothetical protein
MPAPFLVPYNFIQWVRVVCDLWQSGLKSPVFLI